MEALTEHHRLLREELLQNECESARATRRLHRAHDRLARQQDPRLAQEERTRRWYASSRQPSEQSLLLWQSCPCPRPRCFLRPTGRRQRRPHPLGSRRLGYRPTRISSRGQRRLARLSRSRRHDSPAQPHQPGLRGPQEEWRESPRSPEPRPRRGGRRPQHLFPRLRGILVGALLCRIDVIGSVVLVRCRGQLPA